MKTDIHIYTFLAIGTQAFRVLTGMTLPDYYQFSAPVLKGLERRIDAMFEPHDQAGPVYLVEFQAQAEPKAWNNLLVKIAMYSEQHPQQRVQGILIFSHRGLDAQTPDWLRYAAANFISAVYLDETLPELLAREPDNPFVAVLAPLILDNQESLREQAPQLWRTVHATPEPVRTKLEQILELWFLERFRNINEQEVWDMFQIHNLAPLEETLGYKNIFAKGIAHGKAQGMAQGIAKGMNQGMTQGKAELLKRQIIRRFKKLPKWADKRIDKADTEQLEAWAEAIFDAQDVRQLLGS